MLLFFLCGVKEIIIVNKSCISWLRQASETIQHDVVFRQRCVSKTQVHCLSFGVSVKLTSYFLWGVSNLKLTNVNAVVILELLGQNDRSINHSMNRKYLITIFWVSMISVIICLLCAHQTSLDEHIGLLLTNIVVMLVISQLLWW